MEIFPMDGILHIKMNNFIYFYLYNKKLKKYSRY